MKEFFVGLLALAAVAFLSVIGILLLPMIVVLGFLLKWLLTLAFIIFSIWLVGVFTLYAINQVKKGS